MSPVLASLPPAGTPQTPGGRPVARRQSGRDREHGEHVEVEAQPPRAAVADLDEPDGQQRGQADRDDDPQVLEVIGRVASDAFTARTLLTAAARTPSTAWSRPTFPDRAWCATCSTRRRTPSTRPRSRCSTSPCRPRPGRSRSAGRPRRTATARWTGTGATRASSRRTTRRSTSTGWSASTRCTGAGPSTRGGPTTRSGARRSSSAGSPESAGHPHRDTWKQATSYWETDFGFLEFCGCVPA